MSYYFDYGATSLKKPKAVADKVYEVLSSAQYANASRGSYQEANNAFRAVFEARKAISEFFGLKDESRLVFTGNSTESLNIAILGLLNKEDHVITTTMEHNSVLRPIYLAHETIGCEYTIIKGDKTGLISYEDLENAIKPNTKMIAITHGSNVTGNIIDVRKVSEICKKHNLILVVDVSQTAGVIPINVEKDGIDILCFTGHKSLYGPQGIGGLCVNMESPEIRRYKVGGSGVRTFDKVHPGEYPLRLEAGTLNTAGILGLYEGIKYIKEKGIENLYKKQMSFANKFYNSLKGLDCLEFYGDFSKKKTAVVSLNFKGVPAGDVADVLAEEYNIAIRAGAHCAPLMHEVLGTREQGIVRFSFSSMNTEEEIDYAINAIKKIAENI
ncbi:MULTISPECIES: aminotransferase class V-fold PLP-dependent enzyme [Gemella]|uniref:aminotransferase class V-fold PLP-dependent enzyme n=1 Tax=Gemella TaxID=1378 RepID=UPI000767F065|nr:MULTISPECIES: aminotransferase class V-fold PLP-dependent enzyme [Gemella]AME10031.1 cysteine desulfurase [Gemella sp. oral taxon 928]AXI26167.1 cysteine desulfurase [Gemella sp. ND 6198]